MATEKGRTFTMTPELIRENYWYYHDEDIPKGMSYATALKELERDFGDQAVMDAKEIAVLTDIGDRFRTEDLDGRTIEEGPSEERVYKDTEAKGYEVVIKSHYDDEG